MRESECAVQCSAAQCSLNFFGANYTLHHVVVVVVVVVVGVVVVNPASPPSPAPPPPPCSSPEENLFARSTHKSAEPPLLPLQPPYRSNPLAPDPPREGYPIVPSHEQWHAADTRIGAGRLGLGLLWWWGSEPPGRGRVGCCHAKRQRLPLLSVAAPTDRHPAITSIPTHDAYHDRKGRL